MCGFRLECIQGRSSDHKTLSDNRTRQKHQTGRFRSTHSFLDNEGRYDS